MSRDEKNKVPQDMESLLREIPIFKRAEGVNESLLQEVWPQMVANERFLVAMDAFRLGFGSLRYAIYRAFEAPPKVPEGFDIFHFVELAARVADQIQKGEISVPENAKQEFKSFYSKTLEQ